MELPQEIEVFYTLPAVRREIARALLHQGLTQRLIAKKLGVTEAAISQYLSNKRGTIMEYPEKITQAITAAANRIKLADDQAEVRKAIQELSNMMKDDKVICQLHKKHGNVQEGCNTCYQ